MIMKVILFAAVYISFSFLSCKKDNNECVSATIQKVYFNKCGGFEDTAWGIKLDQKTYPTHFPDSIPTAFQQESLKVCIQYKTYSIPWACPCCYDGPYIQILS